MKRFAIFVALLLGFTFPAYAQQDPDDPGMQDSLIIGEISVDSGQTFAFVPIFIVTDDSVGYYNTPIGWDAPGGGIFPGTGSQYFPPYDCWEKLDTVMTDQSYIRHVGFNGGGQCPYLYTNGQRINFWTIRFIIPPTTPRQLVVLDTAWDDRNGSVMLGLSDGLTEITPAVVRGYLGYGVGVDGDLDCMPQSAALSQNYPNPFNPSTEIEFSLPQGEQVSLSIYDIQGREVRRLLDGSLEAGVHSVLWNGLNDDSTPVSSGIYFYRLVSDNSTQTNRMTLLR